MKTTNVKKIIAVLVALMTLFSVTVAAAETSTEKGRTKVDGEADLVARLNALPPFKFWKHSNGIGYGRCPVYTAPSEDAYRCANGKAECFTDQKMDEAGFVSGWLLVRYETNNGGVRVGYIPPRYVRGFKSSMFPHFDYIPAVADDVLFVTDNPMMHNTSFGQLEVGEEFHVLSKYDYYKNDGLEWWYIECIIDGQLAYGFIEMDSSFHLGSSTGY